MNHREFAKLFAHRRASPPVLAKPYFEIAGDTDVPVPRGWASQYVQDDHVEVKVVGLVRFELTTSCTPCKRATRLRYSPKQKEGQKAACDPGLQGHFSAKL